MDKSLLIDAIKELSPPELEQVEKIIHSFKKKIDPDQQKRKAKAGSFKGTFDLKEGFDDPIADFKPYME